jgi:hypothetical protein
LVGNARPPRKTRIRHKCVVECGGRAKRLEVRRYAPSPVARLPCGAFAAGAPAGLGRGDLEPHRDLVLMETAGASSLDDRWGHTDAGGRTRVGKRICVVR